MKRIPGSILRVDLIVIGVVLVWGMNFSIMKGLYAYFDPLAFTALRFSVAVATLSLVLKMRGLSLGVEKKDLPSVIGLGFLSKTLPGVVLCHSERGDLADGHIFQRHPLDRPLWRVASPGRAPGDRAVARRRAYPRGCVPCANAKTGAQRLKGSFSDVRRKPRCVRASFQGTP
jgi:hypothetical protein